MPPPLGSQASPPLPQGVDNQPAEDGCGGGKIKREAVMLITDGGGAALRRAGMDPCGLG